MIYKNVYQTDNVTFILCQLHSMIFNEPLSTTLTICANKIYVFKEVKNSLLGKFFKHRFCRKVYPSVTCYYITTGKTFVWFRQVPAGKTNNLTIHYESQLSSFLLLKRLYA